MSVAPLLSNSLKQKRSNFQGPAPPPCSWSLLGWLEGLAPPLSKCLTSSWESSSLLLISLGLCCGLWVPMPFIGLTDWYCNNMFLQTRPTTNILENVIGYLWGGGGEEVCLARWFVSVVAVKDDKEAYECCSSSLFRCCSTSTETVRAIVGTEGGSGGGVGRMSIPPFTQLLSLRAVRVCCCVQNSDRAGGAGLAAWSKLPRHVGLQQYGTSRKISSSSSSARPAIISVNYYYCGNQYCCDLFSW